MEMLRWFRIFYLVLVTVLKHVSSDPTEIIRANPGEEVTLTFVGRLNETIKAVELYICGDYQSFVFSWRGEDKPDVENQLYNYKGRVHRTDPTMKNNVFSVTIKNVTYKDSFTYECHIYYGPGDSSNPATPFGTYATKNITLIVPDQIRAHSGENVTLSWDVPMNVSFDAVLLHKDGLKDPICSYVREQQQGSSVTDCQMRNNTFLLMLNNVKPNDTGEYKWSIINAQGINNSCTNPTKTVQLTVSDKVLTEDLPTWQVVLVVLVLLVVPVVPVVPVVLVLIATIAAIAAIIDYVVKKHKRQTQQSSNESDTPLKEVLCQAS